MCERGRRAATSGNANTQTSVSIMSKQHSRPNEQDRTRNDRSKTRSEEQAHEKKTTSRRMKTKPEKRAEREHADQLQPRRPNTLNREEVRRESKHRIGQPK